jgi:molybdate transport system regulatory protein
MAGSKGSKYYDIHLDFDVALNHKDGRNAINEYKYKLLEAINETGSLKAAADKMEVSYRKAWGNIEEMEQILGFKVLLRQRGGAQGGKTELTPDGQALLSAYQKLTEDFNQSIYKITKDFFNSINH